MSLSLLILKPPNVFTGWKNTEDVVIGKRARPNEQSHKSPVGVTQGIVQGRGGCSLMYQSVAVGSACSVTRYMNKLGSPYIEKKPIALKLVKNPRIAMRLL